MERWSEVYKASGNAAGAGVLKQLGSPPLERLELFTREVVQNCWDAALDPEGMVSVNISCDRLSAQAQEFVMSNVLASPPPSIDLAAALSESPRILTVSDRGTHGLEGPTRADVLTSGATDFVDFLRNVGQPPDKPLGGGSFGFGKAALYLVSLAHVIVVHSRAKNEDGELETRLLASGLGDLAEEELSGTVRKLTGRHMWGRIDAAADVAEPLRNEECDQIVERMGLPAFEPNETGTDIAIIAPDLRVGDSDGAGSSTRLALDVIARSIAWHFWPKIYGPDPKMMITLSNGGIPVEIPSPSTEPRLAAFESAFFELEGIEPEISTYLASETFDIECHNPRKHLGELVIQTHQIPQGEEPEVRIAAPENGESLCHVAVMRNAELVVKYLKGPELAAGSGGYAGVFRVAKGDVELDQVFRDSEPPSHDDWVPQAVPKGKKRTWVNMASNRIKEKVSEYVGPIEALPSSAENVPLGAFSRQLAGLIPSMNGEGAAPVPGTRTSSGLPVSKASIKVKEPAHPVLVNEVVAFEAEVQALASVRVRAIPNVAVLDGGKPEREAPEGANLPKVIEWRGPNSRAVRDSSIEMSEGEIWTVVVSSPGDAMVLIDFETS